MGTLGGVLDTHMYIGYPVHSYPHPKPAHSFMCDTCNSHFLQMSGFYHCGQVYDVFIVVRQTMNETMLLLHIGNSTELKLHSWLNVVSEYLHMHVLGLV